MALTKSKLNLTSKHQVERRCQISPLKNELIRLELRSAHLCTFSPQHHKPVHMSTYNWATHCQMQDRKGENRKLRTGLINLKTEFNMKVECKRHHRTRPATIISQIAKTLPNMLSPHNKEFCIAACFKKLANKSHQRATLQDLQMHGICALQKTI